MKRTTYTALLASVLLAGTPLLAQEATTPPTAPTAIAPVEPMPVAPATPMAATPPEGYSLLPDWTQVTAEQLDGVEILGPEGAEIAKISDVELGTDGAISGVIADVGGFLGIGAHTVKLGADQISLYHNAEGDLTGYVALDKDALTALPEYTPPAG